ncbi:hypothetical protein Bbelb_122100 [Branchiostoma belcheri]|nr:hypothetical protein Bbelb_122100 [Branchiostoma belcheri]
MSPSLHLDKTSWFICLLALDPEEQDIEEDPEERDIEEDPEERDIEEDPEERDIEEDPEERDIEAEKRDEKDIFDCSTRAHVYHEKQRIAPRPQTVKRPSNI